MKGAGIVVGSAPCLHDDLKRALDLYPFAFVATVNGACVEIEHVDVVVAGHTVKAELFVAAREAAFPDGAPYEVWANYGSAGRRDEFKAAHRAVVELRAWDALGEPPPHQRRVGVTGRGLHRPASTARSSSSVVCSMVLSVVSISTAPGGLTSGATERFRSRPSRRTIPRRTSS